MTAEQGSGRRRKAVVLSGGAVAALGGSLATTGTAGAATFDVTNLDDSGPGSLRQAIDDANNAAGADVITFQSGLTGTITLTTGQLEITDSLDIQGPGASVLTVSGNGNDRVFYLYNGSANIAVTISGLTIADGIANIGGGIANFDEALTLDGVVLDGNQSTGDGGALWADGFDMELSIVDSTFSGNVASDDGGAVYVEDTGAPLSIVGTVISGNTAGGSGGGIYLYDPDNSVSISTSTISGNTAGGVGGGVYLYHIDGGAPFSIDRSTISGNTADAGGGVFLYDLNEVVITNSTISGNSAVAGDGGGVYLYDVSDATISLSTIADNDASGTGGGLFVDSGTVTVDNSIIADNTAGTGPDVGGNVVDLTFSLIGDTTDASLNDIGGNLLDTDPQLGPLQDNLGPTRTMAPAATSPVINAGDDGFAGTGIDQRGRTRVQQGRVDMGAVEVAGATAGDSFNGTEDTPLVVAAPGVLANDPDPGASTIAVATGPQHGTLVLNGDGSFTYTPAANFNGADSFTYTATESDVSAASAGTATVNLTIAAVNDAPTAAADTATATVNGAAVTIPVLANDTDVDGDAITVTAVTQGTKGTVSFTSTGVTYRPNAGATGTDTFTYTVSDGVLSTTATVTVTLTAAATTTTTGAALPRTGAEVGGSLGLGSALTAAGASLTLGGAVLRARLRPKRKYTHLKD